MADLVLELVSLSLALGVRVITAQGKEILFFMFCHDQ